MTRATKAGIIALVSLSVVPSGGLAIYAQKPQIWDDEVGITFRGVKLALGMSEQEFAQKWPGAVKWTGTMSAFYISGKLKRLDQAATTAEAFLPTFDNQEFGYFFFQAGKLVALEVSRFDPSPDGDLTSEIVKKLRSAASEGPSCSVKALPIVSDRGGRNQAQRVSIICGRREVLIGRERDTVDEKPLLGYFLEERLVDDAAKVVPVSPPHN